MTGVQTCALPISKNLNPFINNGYEINLAYIDIYYETVADCAITIEFTFSDNLSYSTSKTLTLSGSDKRNKWKRIYMNVIADFIRMKLTHSTDQMTDNRSEEHTSELQSH